MIVIFALLLAGCAPASTPVPPTLMPTHTPTATIDVSATSMAATETAIVSSTSAAKTEDAIATKQSEKDIIPAAENICGGKGFPGASKYIAKRAFHPLVLFPDKYTYPQEVRPDSLNELEIVACIDESKETISRQQYMVASPGEYYCLNIVQLVTITIRAAQTGEVVHEYEIRGPRPKNPCGISETFPSGLKTISKTGGAPDFTQIWEEIENLVLLDMNGKVTPLPGAISTPQISSASSPPSCDEIGQNWISPVDGMELSCVPAGEFKMGSTESDHNAESDEFPQHTVYLDAFWIDHTEVTNAMFVQFLNEMGNQSEGGADWLDARDKPVRLVKSGSEWQPVSGYGEHPVMNVTWYGAQAYCRWAGRRLPSEAEWEKAARGTDGRTYPWGEKLDCTGGCAGGNFFGYPSNTKQVGAFPNGASPYGALDMAGNISEWVADWFEVYPGGDPGASELFGQEHRVSRGGSHAQTVDRVRSAMRSGLNPVESISFRGFRCARSP